MKSTCPKACKSAYENGGVKTPGFEKKDEPTD